MSLQPGTRLGPYEIAAQIGVGGRSEIKGGSMLSLMTRVLWVVTVGLGPQAFTHLALINAAT